MQVKYATNVLDYIRFESVKPYMLLKELQPQLQCHLNTEGGYDLSPLNLEPGQVHRIYDGNLCIFEITVSDAGYEIQSFTDKQLNILDDLACDAVVIHSKGSIVLMGSVNATLLDIKSERGIALMAPVAVSDAKLDAKIIYLSDNAALSADACLMTSETLQANTDIHIKEKAFIKADYMALNSKQTSLPSKTYLSSSKIDVSGSVHINQGNDEQNVAKINVDRLNVLKSGQMTLYNSELKAKHLKSKGGLNLRCSLLNVEHFRQQGAIDCVDSEIEGRNITLDGESCFNDSIVNAKCLLVKSNQCQFTAGSEVNAEVLEIHKKTKLKIDHSSIDVKNKMLSYGACELNCATLNTDDAYFYEECLKVRHSTLSFSGHCEADFGAEFDRVILSRAESLKLAGNVVACKSKLTARQIDISGEKLMLKQCRLNAKSAKINSGSNELPAIFEKSSLCTGYFEQSKVLRLEKESAIYGTAREKSQFVLNGSLHLDDSRILTGGSIYAKFKSAIEALSSMVDAKSILNRSDFSLNDTFLFSDSLTQIQASLEASAGSNVAIKKTTSLDSSIAAIDSQLALGDLSHSGYLSVKKSQLTSAKVDIKATTGQVSAEEVSMHDGRIDLKKSTYIIGCQLDATEVVLYDEFDIEASVLKAKQRFEFARKSKGAIKKSTIQGDRLTSHADMILEESKLKAESNMHLGVKSITRVNKSVALEAKNATAAGKLIKAEDQDEPAAVASASVTCRIENDLLFDKQSEISLDSMEIFAERTSALGSMSLLDSLLVDGKTFHQNGYLWSDTLTFKLDRGLMCGPGSYTSARTLDAQANVLNFFGVISAQERYRVEGFGHLNFGLIASSNAHVSSLFSANAGFIMPHFTHPSKIFTMNNLYMAARTGVGAMMPNLKNAVDLAVSAPGLISSISDLSNIYQQKGLDGILNLRPHELMPLVCKAKNSVMAGYGAYSQASRLPSTLSNLGGEAYKACAQEGYFSESCKSALYDTNWTKSAKQCVATAGGHYVDDSVAHLNVGGTFAQSTAKTNLLYFNAGQESSLQNHSIDTCWGYNYGQSSGADSSFRATRSMKNYGHQSGSSSLNLDYNHLYNAKGATISGKNVSGKVKDFQQNGQLDLENGRVKFDHYREETTADTDLRSMHVEGDTASFAGKLASKGVRFDFKRSIDFEETLSANLNETAIKAEKFSHKGSMDYDNHVSVEAEKVSFAKGSHIQGERSQVIDEDVKAQDQAEDSIESSEVVAQKKAEASTYTRYCSEKS